MTSQTFSPGDLVYSKNSLWAIFIINYPLEDNACPVFIEFMWDDEITIYSKIPKSRINFNFLQKKVLI